MSVVNIFFKDCKFVCKDCGHLYEQRIDMLKKELIELECPLCGRIDLLSLRRNR